MRLLALLLLLTLPLADEEIRQALAEVAPAGQELARRLDALDVENRWLASRNPVDWETGLVTGPEKYPKPHTRCSQFAAVACRSLGVYLLRPPEHKLKLLANAQFDWLGSEAGRAAGWQPVATPLEAQALANRGWLVLAAKKNPDPKRAGHIAVVRPEARAAEAIEEEGPMITQAGRKNYRRAPMAKGFSNMKELLEQGFIRFFAHPLDL